MDQGSPSLNGALIFFIDSEYLVHDIRTRPQPSVDIQPIAAQAGNALCLPQRFLAVAQPEPRFDVFGNIRDRAEDARDLAVRPGDRVFPIVEPMVRSILRRHLLDLVHAPVFGKCLVLQLVRQIGDGFGVKVVIGLSHKFGRVLRRFRQ